MRPKFSKEFFIPWGDVDLAGVVYFPHFFRYFNDTEIAFYRSLGPTVVELEEGLEIRLPRLDAHCRYVKPVHFGELITVDLSIVQIRTRTMKYGFDVLREGELVANGHLVVGSVSVSDFRSVPLPDKLLELIQPYTSSQATAQKSE